jgi:hypothetical protein
MRRKGTKIRKKKRKLRLAKERLLEYTQEAHSTLL